MNRRQFLASSVAAASAALARPLAAATAPRRSAFGDLDVIVLGAGLAGLNATLLLEEIGLKTLLIECRSSCRSSTTSCVRLRAGIWPKSTNAIRCVQPDWCTRPT